VTAEFSADGAEPARADLATLAARFAARLRAEGLPAGPERSARFAAAITLIEPATVAEVYWSGLATLVADPAEIDTFDRVFQLVFGALADPAESRGDPNAPTVPGSTVPGPPPPTQPRQSDAPSGGGAQADGPSTSDPSDAEQESPFPALAATAERRGGRDFASLSPEELARLVALMRELRLATPMRSSSTLGGVSAVPSRRHPRGRLLRSRDVDRPADVRPGGHRARHPPGTRLGRHGPPDRGLGDSSRPQPRHGLTRRRQSGPVPDP
jgi:uncharacterized protein with von Willebrand factor type A (vWA) domain